MSDASSVRKARTLPTPQGVNASAIRYHNGQLWFSDGTTWQPLATEDTTFQRVTYTGSPSASTAIFTASSNAYRVVGIYTSYATAETTTTTLTYNITNDAPGGAAGSGTPIVQAAGAAANVGFTATGAANTVVSATSLSATASGYYLIPGAAQSASSASSVVGPQATPNLIIPKNGVLSVKPSGSVNQLANVNVTVILEQIEQPYEVVTTVLGNAPATQQFFIADKAYTLSLASVGYTAQSSGACTVQLTKDTGTTAPGAGTATLFNANQSIAASGPLTVYPALSATAASLAIAAGDRISWKIASGAVAGATAVTINLWLTPS
jgi:hypothetical protein